MEFGLVLLIAVAAWFFFGRKGRTPEPDLPEPGIRFTVTRNDPPPPSWNSRDFAWGPRTRPDGLVAMKGGADINVAGTSHRMEVCRAFIRNAVDGQARLELERTPTPEHPHSITIYGRTSAEAERIFLGYVPSDVSALVAGSFSSEMPLAAELRRVGEHRTEDAVFIAFNILVPPAKDRRANGWE